jgi:hypothetical protein
MITLLAALQRIDRRWLFAFTLVALALPFMLTIPLPPEEPAPPTQAAYNLLSACPDDKVVWIDSSWDPGSAPENRSQLQCLVRQLMKTKRRFIVSSIGITVLGPPFAADVIDPLAKEYGYREGTDYALFGYLASPGAGLAALLPSVCNDLHQFLLVDHRGRPVGELPIMESVHSIKDVHAVAVITYAPDNSWFTVIKGQFSTPIVFCCMSIMNPYYQPFYESGQLAGILAGNRGSAQYDKLGGEVGLGAQLTLAVSFANILVIVAAVLGNLAWWAGRRQRRAAA